MDRNALREQINSDPRVLELARSRQRGSIPGYVVASELREMGYDVPDDWKFSSNLTPRNTKYPNPGVFEENDWGDVAAWTGAAAVAGYPFVKDAMGGGGPESAPDAPSTPNGGGGLAGRLKDIATDPRTYLGIASQIPQFADLIKGGRGPSAEESALLDEAKKGMELQRQRTEQTQPVYDALIRMSYGNMPTRHRGAAPAGYQAPTEQYPYAPPRFGGR
jgi:hypothetical protein